MCQMAGTQVDVDADLVDALRRDVPDAAERLVERYGDRVYRLAAQLIGTRDGAEEAARNALLTAIGTIDTFHGDSSFSAWIDRLAAGTAYRQLLTRPRNTGEIALDDVLPRLDAAGRHFEPMDDWSARIDARGPRGELRRAVTEAIDALPLDYRAALVLHDVEGMSEPDIVEALGVGLCVVRTRVHRARLFVRQRLSDHFESA